MIISTPNSLSNRFIASTAVLLAAMRHLCGVVGGWVSIGSARSDLDLLSDAQLADIGLRRFSYCERRLDGSETALPASNEYETSPNAP